MTTVLQIIPNLGAGGAEQACVDVAAGLVAAGHRAIVVSSGGPRVAELAAAGAEHITRNVSSKNPFVMARNALWLAGLIRKQKVDVIHARSRAPAWSAHWASKMTGCPFVTTFHAAYKFANPTKKFYNSVMAKGERVIAISEFIASHIRESYGISDSIRTVPRGIDFQKFTPSKVTPQQQQALRKAWGIAPDTGLILLPSRLSPIKGQAVLIEAMTRLPKEFADVKAIILGDDQGRDGYRRSLQNLIAERNLGARVKLVPHCDNMPVAYSLASLVVAPSLVPEGFGRVPVEAMAIGVPVIASYLGGFAETIRTGETGWLVQPGDAAALSDAIANALKQPESERKLMTEKARDIALACYDKRKMVADTLAVYAELATEHYPPLAPAFAGAGPGLDLRSKSGEGL